jgi:hypothetical protein
MTTTRITHIGAPTTLLEAPGRPTIQITATPAATAHR